MVNLAEGQIRSSCSRMKDITVRMFVEAKECKFPGIQNLYLEKVPE
jgi:hypothetical protein